MFIKPSKGRITSPFGMRTHPVTGKPSTMHWGIDYGRDGGTVIVAAASGKVTYAKSTNGYGNTVMIVHTINGKTYETVYAHLASIGVRVGQFVKQGDVIAVMGTTGVSTGVHLHFEVHEGRWNNKFTNAKNPLHYVVDPDIEALQQLLVKVGHKLTIDGINGPGTVAAVKAFQKSAGLVVDGSAGPATMAALEKATTPAPPKEEENDEMAEQLPKTQQNDMRTLLQSAFDNKVFSVNHASKVDKMTRGEAVDLLISYTARTTK